LIFSLILMPNAASDTACFLEESFSQKRPGSPVEGLEIQEGKDERKKQNRA